MWLGLTIARSSPASTQWCRKTELRTARGRGETPKETLETPSEVFTPGISALIRRIPSIVSTAEGFHSSSPVVRVKVSASKISASGSRPCSSQAMSRIRLAISTLRSAVFAIPTSSIVSAISAAPCALASGTTTSALSRPASRLIELTIARPGICSSAALITSGSVESTWIGAGWVSEIRFDHRAHLLVLVLALGQRDADVEHVGAAFDLVFGDLDEAVVVVGEQQLLGLARALRVDPLADQGRARLLHQRGRGHHRGDLDRARRRALAGHAAADPLADRGDVLGRRPAAAADDADAVALDELAQRRRQRLRALRGRSSRRRGPAAAGRRWGCSGPAAGCVSPRKRIASRMSSGPVEQLSPITSTSSAAQRRQHRLDVGAEQHLAAVGEQRDAGLDRQRAAGLARTPRGRRRSPP